MKTSSLLCTSLLSLALVSGAQAVVTLDWVTVGDAGNAADTTGYGAVGYTYQIMKYEVTNAQYAEFLNAVADTDPNGLYNTSMASDGRAGITRSGSDGSFTYSVKPDFENKPVNFVSSEDAQRFANWIHNGQPTGPQGAGTTETGAYNTLGSFVVHTSNAAVWIPTADEWYKAAYYQPTANGGDTDNYWAYATRSNGVPTQAGATINGDVSNPGANVANYDHGAAWNGQGSNVTTVGGAGPLSASYYGTFDQTGNVSEFREGSSQAHGGSFTQNAVFIPSVGYSSGVGQDTHASGFRLAAAAVPEPSRAMLLLAGLGAAFLRRRR